MSPNMNDFMKIHSLAKLINQCKQIVYTCIQIDRKWKGYTTGKGNRVHLLIHLKKSIRSMCSTHCVRTKQKGRICWVSADFQTLETWNLKWKIFGMDKSVMKLQWNFSWKVNFLNNYFLHFQQFLVHFSSFRMWKWNWNRNKSPFLWWS